MCLANETLQNLKSHTPFLAESQSRFVFSKKN